MPFQFGPHEPGHRTRGLCLLACAGATNRSGLAKLSNSKQSGVRSHSLPFRAGRAAPSRCEAVLQTKRWHAKLVQAKIRRTARREQFHLAATAA